MAIEITSFDLAQMGVTAGDIKRAQFDLDHHPKNSSYWESRAGQDALFIIEHCELKEATDESFRRAWNRDQISAGEEE